MKRTTGEICLFFHPGAYVLEKSIHRELPLQIEIRFTLSKLTITAWQDDWGSKPPVVLTLDLLGPLVKLDDLKGNGKGNLKAHRRGIGTLLINIAIQILKGIYRPETCVFGHAYPNEHSAPAKEELLRYWGRFNLMPKPGGVFGDMETTVDALTYCDGAVARSFGTILPINEFKILQLFTPN